MITIDFHIFLRGGVDLTEASLLTGGFTYDDLFDDFGSSEGAIVISDPQNETLRLEDELPALIKNLCFAANAELQRTGESTYYFNGYDGQVFLSRDGQTVKLDKKGISISYDDYDRFINELAACGDRFIELLRKIRCRNTTREDERLSLISLLETAKEELTSIN